MRTPNRRRDRRALPAGLLAAAVASAALLFSWGGPASAATDVEAIRNGGFNIGNHLTFWSCGRMVLPASGASSGLQGYPGDVDYAGCSQEVPVEPSSTYTLTANVQGPYVFVGATGTGGPDPSLWSNLPQSNVLRTTFTTGPSTTSVTVWFHGWYLQGPYVINHISLFGPGKPQPCWITLLPVAPTSPAAFFTPTPGGGSFSPTPDTTVSPSPGSSVSPSPSGPCLPS
ncbi:hypothetical protein [Kitasatospora terrestris]|uniref:Uncharacterized protein n=1 Tax=Kitasatospora terrestris TaxID=258051 RepID=A0ABP9D921_9ACTN